MKVDNVSETAVNEAYILISAYVREEGKLGANYDKDRLKEFLEFLSGILKHPENFNPVEVEEV